MTERGREERSGGMQPLNRDEGLEELLSRAESEHEELLGAQSRMAALHERFDELFEGVPVALMVVDRQGMLLRANRQGRSLLGMESGAGGYPSRRLMAAMERGHRSRLLRGVDEALRTDAALVRGLGMTLEDGRSRLVDVHVQRLAEHEGDRSIMLAVLDREDERVHDRNRFLFTALLDSTDDLVYAFDPDGRLLFANRALSELIGRPAEDLLGQTRDDFLPLSDAITHRTYDERVLREGATLDFREEFHAGPSSGGTRIFETRKFPIVSRDGELVGVGGVSRDVTANAALRRDQRISELVFQHSSDAIIVTDSDARIVRVNPAFERLTGFGAERVVGRKVSILRSDRQSPGFYREMWRELLDRGHWAGELVNRNAHGDLFTVWVSISVLRDENRQVTGYMAVETDMAALRQAQEHIDRLARFDPLTGLPNRTLLMDRLEQLVRSAGRRERAFAVLFVDLDHFKDVNDTLGHAAGDELLQRIATRLRQELRADDTVARLGGDEFVVLLPETQQSAALEVANKLVQALSRPIDLQRAQGYRASLSLGVAVYPQHGETSEELLQHADTAMYAAKSAGRDRVVLYNGAMSERADWQFHLCTELPRAIEAGQLRLHLQPKFALGDRRLVGAEGLIRWYRNGDEVPLMPGEFIWALEQGQLLNQLDDWVLAEAIRLLGDWRQRGLLFPGFTLAVNQTATYIDSARWLPRIVSLIQQAELPAGALEVELTENILAQPNPQMLTNLAQLRELGVALSIDDFGTGYSSLAYLQRLPVSVIKIDQSFVRNMVDNASDHALVQTIVSLAHNLGHHTVAEGIETEEQRRTLMQLGCDWGQGYLVSPAVPVAEFEQRFLAPAVGARRAA